jgi:hypothetical protein
MRKTRFALATVALTLICTPVRVPAAERFSDQICPQATLKVIAFTEMGAQPKINLGDLRKVTHEVVDRYDDCTKQKLADGYIEPKMHYAQTRAASFLVVAARVEANMTDFDTAQADLDRARSLATEVRDWTPMSQSYSTSNMAAGMSSDRNTSKRESDYKEAAKAILVSIPEAQALIPKLQVQPAAGAPAPKPPTRS